MDADLLGNILEHSLQPASINLWIEVDSFWEHGGQELSVF